MKTKSNAAVAQFDCSSAFNHAGRTVILSHIRRLSPHLARSFYNILSRTTLNLVRKEDGSTSMIPPYYSLTQGPAAFSFLIMLVEEFFWPEVEARARERRRPSISLPTWTTSRLSLRKDSWRTPPERWEPLSRRHVWS